MGSRSLTYVFVGLGILLFIAFSSMFRIFETQQALVLEFGRPVRTIQEPGLHFKLPWQSVNLLDRRILHLDTPSQEVITSDQKRVIVDAFARFQVSNPLLVRQSVGDEFGAANRLETIVNSTIRQVLGSAPFSSILSEERLNLLDTIRNSVNQAGQGFG
ncbi:MAG: SPFH domain-containing protein, partial [Sphingomonadales bacterium]